MRTKILGEPIAIWALMIFFIVIIGLIYYVAWMSGGFFGENWSLSCGANC